MYRRVVIVAHLYLLDFFHYSQMKWIKAFHHIFTYIFFTIISGRTVQDLFASISALPRTSFRNCLLQYISASLKRSWLLVRIKQIAFIGFGCHVKLTAVLLIAPVGAVTEAVTAEAPDDAVDTISAGEKCGGALRLDLSWGQIERGGSWGKVEKFISLWVTWKWCSNL